MNRFAGQFMASAPPITVAKPAARPRALTGTTEPRLVRWLLTSLAVGFLAKMLALALGTAVLWAWEVKFPALAAFALAFAAASLLVQLVSAALLNRALNRGTAMARPLHRT